MHPEARSMTRAAALVAVLALNWAVPCTAQGPVWIVGSLADSGPSTLRNALVNAGDGATIGFEVSGTIALTSGELEVTNNVTIQAGNETVTVDGGQQFRVFKIALGKTVAISGLTIANGYTSAKGGGVYSAGKLTLTDCTLRDNWAAMGGGGVYTEGDAYTPVALTLTDCTLNGNATSLEAYYGGGAVALAAVRHDYLGLGVSRVDTLAITNSLLTGNDAPYGGAIDIDVTGGTGYLGWDEALAAVTVINSTLSDNLANSSDVTSYGGAITVSVNGESVPSSMAFVSVENCTLSGNVVTNGAGFAIGGALFGMVNDSCWLTVDFKNSTLSGNTAESADGNGMCGAITMMNFGGLQGQLTLSNCTLSGNRDTGGTSGILNDGGTVDLENTLLANAPSGTNLVNGWMVGGGSITSHGCNLSTDGGGGFLTATGDRINTDPALGPLQDNGGPTRTCALLAGSPAIDAGQDTGSLSATDQRCTPRIVNGAVDIGAFESGFEGCFITKNDASGDSVVLEWTAFPMWRSTVMYSTNLVSMPFAILTNGMAYPVNSYTDLVHAAGNQCFYRVEIAP